MNIELLRVGLLLGFAAVFFQIAVFIQPLLPKQYQVAPVCETITLLIDNSEQLSQKKSLVQHALSPSSKHLDSSLQPQMHHQHDHHDPSHQCQYCTVYGNLVLPPEIDLRVVIDRIQIRLISLQKALLHVYFELQRLFLLPQGRAPPLFI
ncbi:DUF2946 domain-containing protein [Acinetobacter rudis]|uniref:DUF2946 domain-containing protein n=1 Tax=Acinetobacter rudis TaxID=632955 RepID=A0AAW8J383_9GAMM|nr:DUF2946 domain-containing protein [Acinetobacter rudis]MDQ8934133.1 DUF2946 domain-containing protein [Acinetobacter rudis]MDQ8954413.1 DUF2946 domain-containing protein [Acinetobacter rudis]MDQ9016559.1 DUF2946 domain-containing protein [Acinetobacter rudis]